MKNIALIAGDQVHDIVLKPGTTVHDIRQQARLPDNFFISQRDGLPFGDNEVIYGHVTDGAKLYASPPANVAAVNFLLTEPAR